VAGVIGARRVPGLEWWDGEGVGRCAETRGVVDFGTRTGDVDAVDGLILVLSPWAVRNLRFDSATFAGFHAYDIDFCLQARAAGRTVKVIDVDLFHHTKGGFGDEVGFRLADAAFRRKWGLAPAAVGGSLTCPTCRTTLVRGPQRAEHEVQLCPQCGLGATYPQTPLSNEGDDAIWIETYGGQRLAARQQWVREAELRVTWLQLHAPDGLLLEVGSGTGEFVAVAQTHGYDAHGCEPSPWASDQARRFGARVATATLAEWGTRNSGLRPDIVAAFHVFEHLHEPRGFLREVREVLAPGGTLALEVPNFDSIFARRHTFDWIGVALSEHVYHYTAASLVKILQEEGFVVDSQVAFSTRVYDSPQVWQTKRTAFRNAGMAEAPRDMLRVVARAPRVPVEAQAAAVSAAA
jgi:SAM-dependent methyltransferase